MLSRLLEKFLEGTFVKSFSSARTVKELQSAIAIPIKDDRDDGDGEDDDGDGEDDSPIPVASPPYPGTVRRQRGIHDSTCAHISFVRC